MKLFAITLLVLSLFRPASVVAEPNEANFEWLQPPGVWYQNFESQGQELTGLWIFTRHQDSKIPLKVELRSSDLKTRFFQGTVKPTDGKAAWRKVVWTQTPKLAKASDLTLVVGNHRGSSWEIAITTSPVGDSFVPKYFSPRKEIRGGFSMGPVEIRRPDAGGGSIGLRTEFDGKTTFMTEIRGTAAAKASAYPPLAVPRCRGKTCGGPTNIAQEFKACGEDRYSFDGFGEGYTCRFVCNHFGHSSCGGTVSSKLTVQTTCSKAPGWRTDACDAKLGPRTQCHCGPTPRQPPPKNAQVVPRIHRNGYVFVRDGNDLHVVELETLRQHRLTGFGKSHLEVEGSWLLNRKAQRLWDLKKGRAVKLHKCDASLVSFHSRRPVQFCRKGNKVTAVLFGQGKTIQVGAVPNDYLPLRNLPSEPEIQRFSLYGDRVAYRGPDGSIQWSTSTRSWEPLELKKETAKGWVFDPTKVLPVSKVTKRYIANDSYLYDRQTKKLYIMPVPGRFTDDLSRYENYLRDSKGVYRLAPVPHGTVWVGRRAFFHISMCPEDYKCVALPAPHDQTVYLDFEPDQMPMDWYIKPQLFNSRRTYRPLRNQERVF